MNVLRGLLFDNLGIKFVALLLAVLVYLNVYTDRPALMTVTFPLSVSDLSDSLSLSGPMPAAVQAEIRGTGKQLIRLRLTEPHLFVSLSGARPGHFERSMSAADLPLTPGLQVERLIGPRIIEFELERKARRRLPVAPRVEGVPASGVVRDGDVTAEPESVLVTGPAKVLAKLDSVRLAPVRLDGKRDTVSVQVGAESLPDWCVTEPPAVTVIVPLQRGRQ